MATNHIPDVIAPLMIWGVTEMWVVLIASSVAPIWPLLRQSASHINQSNSHNIFSRIFSPLISRSTKDKSKNVSESTLNPSSAAGDDQGVPHHAHFRRLGSQANLGDIEMTRNFTVRSEVATPRDRNVEGEGFAQIDGGTKGPKG